MGLFDYLFRDKPIYKWINHRNIYLLGIAVILSGIAWSNFLMSLGQFILAGNWVLEFSLLSKLKAIAKNRLFWILIATYLFLILGLKWTSDYDYAFHDLRIKLPLFLLPFFFVSAKPLSIREWKALLLVYLSCLILLNFYSYYKLIHLFGTDIIDKRQLSVKISHIRYGLNIAFACILCFYYADLFGKKYKLSMYTLALWFLTCLIAFQLYTGLSCLLIIGTVIGIYRLFTLKKLWLQAAIILGIICSSIFLYSQYSQSRDAFYSVIQLDYDEDKFLKQYTVGGEEYWNDIFDPEKENGVYVSRFIAWKELEREWNKRSKVSFHGKDLKGQFINKTICRYLSSKGLKKDSIGLSLLKDEEIEAIENGKANVFYTQHNPIKNRIYSIIYELENYKKTGYASGFSLVMRIKYWETAYSIIRSNFLFGVGTGDIESAFLNQYDKDESSLDMKYRKRTHNQYLTIWASIGLLGLLVFIFSQIYPLIIVNRQILLLYISFFLMVSLSSLTEDTLETQAGVTFYTLFNCIFLYGMRSYRSVKDS